MVPRTRSHISRPQRRVATDQTPRRLSLGPRYIGRKHPARLGPDNLCGVDRPPRDEDERPRRSADLPLPDQEEKLPLKDVEQLIAAVVNMAWWPGLRGVVASRNPIEPPVSSPVAFSVMPPVPEMVRPSPGPRMIPPGAFALCFRASDSLMASSLPLKAGRSTSSSFSSTIHFLGGPTLILKHTATRRCASAEGLFTELPRRGLPGN